MNSKLRNLIFTVLLTAGIAACDEAPKGKNMADHKNHLQNETSPYLLQHADNPVNWYPWGPEALELAIKQDKPILVSIGYSACHWCHVMEHESFEDPETAGLMNELFICIKVDREERPDIDQVYMTFVQMTTGSGGWPLNVFLTPQQEPYFGGTYFPPERRYGRGSWKEVLHWASDFYHNKKDKLQENTTIIREEYAKLAETAGDGEIPGREILEKAAAQLSSYHDAVYGGLGRAPKFPATLQLSFLLQQHYRSGEQKYLDVVTHSLLHMARGGIYDQIGGGFARYSVDEKWLVPHFEKMLYDNAQLVPLYLDTYLVTGDAFYLQVAEHVLEFTMRELRSPEGGFYSSLDADSEGEEGKFYVWDKSAIVSLLGSDNGAIFTFYYGVSDSGNFEGKNILHQASDVASCAKKFHRSEDEIREILNDGRKKLLAARGKRIRPGLDDKVIVSWNGLMLSAFARAYQVTGNPEYAGVIRANIDFVRENMTRGGQLLRSYNRGQAVNPGYLDDYAFWIRALLDSYEALFEESYLADAKQWADFVAEHFWDENDHGYFFTPSGQQNLFARMKDEHDQSIPSGSGIMIGNLLRLYSITDDATKVQTAEQLLALYGDAFSRNPYGYASHLQALDFYLSKPLEIFILSDSPELPENFRSVIFRRYLPAKIVFNLPGGSRSEISARQIEGRERIGGKATVYVCRDFSCSLPVTEPGQLENLLK
jgi:uncharacterized protein YyaL (SSP411 family)